MTTGAAVGHQVVISDGDVSFIAMATELLTLTQPRYVGSGHEAVVTEALPGRSAVVRRCLVVVDVGHRLQGQSAVRTTVMMCDHKEVCLVAILVDMASRMFLVTMSDGLVASFRHQLGKCRLHSSCVLAVERHSHTAAIRIFSRTNPVVTHDCRPKKSKSQSQ